MTPAPKGNVRAQQVKRSKMRTVYTILSFVRRISLDALRFFLLLICYFDTIDMSQKDIHTILERSIDEWLVIFLIDKIFFSAFSFCLLEG